MKFIWPLLIVYAVVTIGDWIASYWVSGFVSVALSVFVSVVTFGIGYYMLQQVDTITHNIR